MTEPPVDAVPRRTAPDALRVFRWAGVATWAVVFGIQIVRGGIPWYRSDLLLWLALGLAAASIGRRSIWKVVVDIFPLAAVLIVYDQLRGISDTLGMPTWWYPQITVDRALFFGHEPTVWLQEHLKYGTARWWDVLVALCYISFFFLPYVTAAVLWLRSRKDYWRWSLQFIALSFLGFAFFALTPAAPPWAAADCSALDVAGHPHGPACLGFSAQYADGGLLGAMRTHQPGANPWIERIALRGLDPLHLHFARAVITTGQGGVDLVAAVPSLHAGGILLFSIFLWRRVNRWWRPVLVLYPLAMAFTLVYSAEHYLADVLAGWLAAALVALAAVPVERRLSRGAQRRRDRAGTVDTLKAQPPSDLESPCPPTQPLPKTKQPEPTQPEADAPATTQPGMTRSSI